MMEKLEHKFEIIPGYDFRKESDGNYGCHGCEIRLAVVGQFGAISLTIYTDWYPETANPTGLQIEKPWVVDVKPWVVDVGVHSRKPIEYLTENHNCHLLSGAPCLYDGTSLNEKWQRGIIHGGTAWLWGKMEQLYQCQFENGEYPNLSVEPRKLKIKESNQ